MRGYVHSIETMGLVDGPGTRTVFFLQGCPLRCAYCHNPDTQKRIGGEELTPSASWRSSSATNPTSEKRAGSPFPVANLCCRGNSSMPACKFLSRKVTILV
jgi:pyruvate-formate lyase-activating enzyme